MKHCYDEVVRFLSEDIGEMPKVKGVVYQEMIWPGKFEARLFTDKGIYSAVFDADGHKETPFILLPAEVK